MMCALTAIVGMELEAKKYAHPERTRVAQTVRGTAHRENDLLADIP